MGDPCLNCAHPKASHPHPHGEGITDHCYGTATEMCSCREYKDTTSCKAPAGAETAKLLSDGRRCCLYRTITGGGRFLIGPADDDFSGDEEYMFEQFEVALVALVNWDGYGEPKNWIRHKVGTQTRRKAHDGAIAVIEDP